MDDRHVMRLIKAAEKIATDLDRIAGAFGENLSVVMLYDQLVRVADALEAANAADPVKLIGDALAAEVKETPQNGDPLAHIPESERYRFQ